MNYSKEEQEILRLFSRLDQEAHERAESLDTVALRKKLGLQEVLPSTGKPSPLPFDKLRAVSQVERQGEGRVRVPRLTQVLSHLAAWPQALSQSPSLAAACAAFFVGILVVGGQIRTPGSSGLLGPQNQRSEMVIASREDQKASPSETQEISTFSDTGGTKRAGVEEMAPIAEWPSQSTSEGEKRLVLKPVEEGKSLEVSPARPVMKQAPAPPRAAAVGKQDDEVREPSPEEETTDVLQPSLKILNNVLDLRTHEQARIILTGSGRVTVKVFDRRGRLVHRLFTGSISGRRDILWSGTDRSGEPLPAGVYLVRVQLGSWVENAKVVLKK